MCLDEMTGVQVPKGAIFHQGSRLRRRVVFSEPVRRQVEEAAGAVRATLASRQVPAPANDPRCGDCSLPGILPAGGGRRKRGVCGCSRRGCSRRTTCKGLWSAGASCRFVAASSLRATLTHPTSRGTLSQRERGESREVGEHRSLWPLWQRVASKYDRLPQF